MLKPVDYNKLIKDLETVEWSTLKSYLAFDDQVNYGNGVESMIAKMRPPAGSSHRLSLYKVVPNRNFELAIFQTPWTEGNVPYLPLIVGRTNSLIYGIMLPFNEISPLLSKRQRKEISSLSIFWTGFAVELNFGIDLSA